MLRDPRPPAPTPAQTNGIRHATPLITGGKKGADLSFPRQRMLAFVGAPYNKRCLDFHENRRYARTASHAQVSERLY